MQTESGLEVATGCERPFGALTVPICEALNITSLAHLDQLPLVG